MVTIDEALYFSVLVALSSNSGIVHWLQSCRGGETIFWGSYKLSGEDSFFLIDKIQDFSPPDSIVVIYSDRQWSELQGAGRLLLDPLHIPRQK